jgi:O-antigen ligase
LALTIAVLGVTTGLLASMLGDMETRWVVYFTAGTLFLTVLLIAHDKERLLWTVLVLGLQFDVSVRLMYGHAGSPGFTFPLPVVVALALAIVYLLSGRFTHLRTIQFGGRLGLPIAALFLTSAFSLAVSSEQFVGLTTLLTLFELYLIYLLALNGIRSQAQLERTLKLLFLILALQSVIYYLQSALGVTFSFIGQTRSAGDLPRPGGTVGTTPSGFSNFIVPLLLIATAHFIAPVRTDGRPRWLALLVGLGLGALALTLTRSAWGAYCLGFAWIVMFGWRRRVLSLSKLAITVCALTLVALAATPRIIERLNSAPFEHSYRERVALMQMAINVIRAHPVAGVGPGAYEMTYKRYLTPELADKWQWSVHNHYLLRTAELGLPGGLALVLLLALGLRQAMLTTDANSALVRTTALGWSAGIVSQAFSMYWDMWTFFCAQSLFWFLLGVTGAAERLDAKNK